MSQSDIAEQEKHFINYCKSFHNFDLSLLDNGNSMLKIQIMNVSDFVEAIFFIIPEGYFNNILYAQIETSNNIIDFIERDKCRIINKIDNLIVVQPLFLNSESMKFPLILAPYEHIFVKLILSHHNINYNTDMFKVAVLYQHILYESNRYKSALKKYKTIYNYNNDNVISFDNGFINLEKNNYKFDNTKELMTKRCGHIYDRNVDEFHKYISPEIVNEFYSYHPVNTSGYFDPIIKKAK